MRRLFVLVAAALVVRAPVPAAPAGAEEGPVTWGVQPSTVDGPDGRAAFDLKLDPGATLVDFVAVSNFSDAELTVKLYASDAFTTASGGFDLLPSGTPPVDVGAWIALNEATVTIPPRSRVDVPFSIAVPHDATPGDHVGGIVAAVPEQADGVTVERRVGARVHLRVTGALTPALEIDDLSVGYRQNLNPFGTGRIPVSFTVRNTGNVRLAGVVSAVVSGPFGLGERTVELGVLPQILPGDEFAMSTVVDDVWPLFRLTTDVTAAPASMDGTILPPNTVPGRADAAVWAVPWSQLAVLVLLIAAVWTGVKLRRRAKRRMKARIEKAAAALAASAVLLAGCGVGGASGDGLQVVASTEVIADLVANIGGDRVTVETVVPPGGDPHSYEPSPQDATKVSRADVAFTNHLLLEEHALIKLFDGNVGEGVPNISLAEHAEPYGATLMPLVEDLGLDVIWLGLAVRGEGPSRTADIRLTATEVTGPGRFAVYLTEALGNPDVYIDSGDGIDEADSVLLPPNAHTHVNWAFTEPGVYELSLSASLEENGTSTPLGEGTVAFAVGTDPSDVEGRPTVLADGHTDLAVDLDTKELFARTDERGDFPASEVVIEVPDRSKEAVPDDERFAFLGEPGTEIHQLPQAVLGKHVHGEIDPHLWQDVRNAKAYAGVITDTLIGADPDGRDTYEANRDAYLTELDDLHAEVAEQIAAIPEANRQLVTTHDAFGYLAKAYGMTVAGFVVPNPAAEPSAAQVEELTSTIRDLKVRAVFVEPNLHARASVLRQVAEDLSVQVCRLHGDALPQDAPAYVDMMRQNAAELRRCLGEGA